MVGIRWLGGALALLGWVGGSLVTTAASRPPSAESTIFTQAARQSGVPLSVLVGLAWEQSFLSDHGGQPSIDGGYGLLDLSRRRAHDTLDPAARLIHSSPAILRHDDRLNVLGGALLLAQYQRSLTGVLPPLPGAWADAIVQFTGIRSAFAAHLVLDDLYRRLRHGVAADGLRLAPVAGAWPRMKPNRHLLPLLRAESPPATSADYSRAIWQPANPQNYSPAHRPRGHPIQFIVIHDTEGSCGAAVNTFQDPAAQASAHYIVCLDGTVIQTVAEHDIAWHAGNWPINQRSIGIEHEGYRDQGNYTRAQYLASAALVRYLCQKYGLNPNRDVIFGHENVPAADHTDPGPHWNWSFYLQRVRHDALGYTGGATDVASVANNALVYTCPKQSCAVLGSANWGEEFAIAAQQPGWEEIWYAGRLGWIAADSVAAGSGYLLTTSVPTGLYLGPGTKSNPMTSIPAGQTYVSLSHNGRFWYVAYNHRYGFLPAAAVHAIDCSTGWGRACLAPTGSPLAVVPDAAPPNMAVTVAGTGLLARSQVTLTVDDQAVGEVRTDGSGSFSGRILLPATLPSGARSVIATDPTGRQITTSVLIEPPLMYTPQVTLLGTATSPGGHETVAGSGFPAETAVTVTATFPLVGGASKRMVLHTFSRQDGTLADVSFTIPRTTLDGAYALTASAPGAQAVGPLLVQPPTTATPTPTATVPASPISTPTATPAP